MSSALAPGAEVLLKTLTNPSLPPEQQVDVKKQIRHLTAADWALIVRAFDAWPFAPEVSTKVDVSFSPRPTYVSGSRHRFISIRG